MVQTSKVLTVSYGTFSCTLEGFDDSFETMKAIAEYFRDLAADDRYFGAEPATPDAEVLARIAEKDVARRVEAHQDGDKVVLRTALPAADIPTEEQIEDAVQADADAGTDAGTDGEADADNETSERADAAPQTNQADAHEEATASEEERKELEEQEALEAEKRSEVRARRQARREAAEQAEREAKEAAEREAEAEAKKKAELKKPEESEADHSAENQDRNSVAAKLARIRAVVGRPTADAAPDFSEDEHAEDIMQGRVDDTDLEDVLEAEKAVPTAKEGDEDTISAVMARLDPASEEQDAEPEIDQNDTAEDQFEFAEQPPAQTSSRARVIKMKRKEFEAALENGLIEEQPDEETPQSEEAQGEDIPTDASSSEIKEDKLARELAEIEAELAGEAAPEQVHAENEAELGAEVSPSTQLERVNAEIISQPDSEMKRLIDHANSELEEPEAKKRRNALGHLRAAVAATRADKRDNASATPIDETADYREDLQSTVKPRRPVRRLSASEEVPAVALARPPLKLVEEQRVDTPSAAADVAMPVRPRRVSVEEATAPSALAPEGGTFMEFAEEMGTTDLPDLLEAAAAYLAYVEGQEQFSRPQLMSKVRMVQEDNFSREDGLRSFGQLLRQGKIEKTSGGRFTVSERISFKPETRAAG